MGQQDSNRNIIEQIIAKLGVEPREIQYDEQYNVVLLNLASLKLTQVPVELGQLSSLQMLYLSGNQLTQVPMELGKLSSLQALDLSENQLTQIPAELGKLLSLQELDLSGNQLTQVPMELGKLSNLQALYLLENQLTQVPMELGKLSNLQTLYLSENRLTQVPVELGKLSSLQTLYLSGNQLTQVPMELGKLSSLQVLDLSENQLTRILVELGKLSSLQMLYLSKNQLTEVPVELGQLSSLQTLYLSENLLTEVPMELGQLSSLQVLYLSENRLTQVPVELGQLSSLQVLYLSENRLTQVPVELGQLSSLQVLYLSENRLTQVPVELGQLSSLQELDLSRNQLMQVPVELGQLSSLQMVDLSENQLTQVPVELGQLSSLQVLDLSRNQLMQVPMELGQLSSLQELDSSENQLTQVPVELGKLSSLQVLYLSGNQLMQVPVELGQLSSLQVLDLSRNQLTQVPMGLGKLSSLQVLYLSGNQLTEIPVELGQLSRLQTLYLSENQLTEIPVELGQLSSLQKLDLSGNRLTQVPVELGRLLSLQILYLSENQLTQVPVELGQLSRLQTLYLSENSPLLTPPPEIVSQGTSAILAFLQELHYEHYLKYEAKLLLVGEGGTGKSSLLRALCGNNFDLSLSTTHGIEVNILELPHPLLLDQALTLNTWDFGGQDIYHATHQFFLTKRSLYLVVWNARLGGEPGRLDYWLNTIRVLAPDAPVLLVATHIDERAPDINVPRYKADYPQIKAVLQVSSKSGEGIDALRLALAQYAARLPLMGQPWPLSWIDIEWELSNNPEHHIGVDVYMDFCTAQGVRASLAQGTLGNYLHDLGKILYFGDDPILSKLVILKPNWVTKAISLVLEDAPTKNRNGILQYNEFSRIWAVDEHGQCYDPSLYKIFLRLMERFDLCYQIDPGEYSTSSLIPQLLPYQPPSILPGWTVADENDGKVLVKLTYRLDFVPAGIMSWFIVRTHRYTKELHWREGVVLFYHEHFARVELFPASKEIRIEVWGIEPRTFLVILKETVDLILSRFEGLRVKQEVPCTCHQMRGEAQPCLGVYDYEEDLVKRFNRGKETIECRMSFQEVSVRNLLYGIHRSTSPQVRTVIQAGQQEVLQHLSLLLSKDDTILAYLQRNNQLHELELRYFMRQWNFEMRKMEAECPNTFFLVPGSTTPFNPSNWIRHDYKLFLMCQYPSGPHCIADSHGYDLRRTKEWWVKVSPWLKSLVTFLKFSVPLAGATLGVVLDENVYKQLDKQVELLDQMIEDMPEIAKTDLSTYIEVSHHLGFEQNIGAALRVLHSFLLEADPQRYWDGLQKVVTEDGNIFWLCEKHAYPYMVQPFQP